MEIIVAGSVGIMTFTGIYLLLRGRSFSIILGLVMLTYAVNLFLFSMGRLLIDKPPVIETGREEYTDPVPQALVLTAIVISFGMTALLVVLSLRSYLENNHDSVAELLLTSDTEEDT
jgi:multicomponent K+:H+ antiporter subunit C